MSYFVKNGYQHATRVKIVPHLVHFLLIFISIYLLHHLTVIFVFIL